MSLKHKQTAHFSIKAFMQFGFLDSFLDKQNNLYNQSYNTVFWVENSS